MKKLSAFFTFCFILLAIGICAHADALEITTTSLPQAVANSSYSAKIEAAGGTAPYTFSLASIYDAPPGLTMDSDGNWSGVPTSGGYTFGGILVRVTDADNNTAEKTFSIAIYAQQVYFEIGQNNFEFDNLPHKLADDEITAKVNGKDVKSLIDYVITYGGAETQTNVGSYPIRIVVNTPGYIFGRADKSRLFINKNSDVVITFGDDVVFNYDGNAHSPSYSAKGRVSAEASYEDLHVDITYEGVDVNYPATSTPPTMPGTYRLYCDVSDANFATPADNSITFEILHNTVNFTLNDQTPFYQGDTWNRTYSADKTLTKPFTVEYVKDGTSYSAPAVFGTYSVRITLDEADSALYSVGTVTPSSINVLRHEVTFDIQNITKTYNGSGQAVDITETEYNLQPGTDYTVSFVNDDTTDTTNYDLNNLPVNAGTYTYTISPVPTSSYTFEPIVGKFTISPVTVKFTLSPESYLFDNTEKAPAVTVDPADFSSDNYTVKYKLNGEEKALREKGEYDVEYVLTDDKNYTVDASSTSKITIAENTIDFTITDTDYTYGDGQNHKATVTASDSEKNPFTDFTVTYKNQDTSDTKVYTDTDMPVNAGTYDIIIQLDGYTKGTVTGKETLTIDKKPIEFSISQNEFDYVGADIDPSSYITVTPAVTGLDYTLVYHIQGDAADLNVLHDAGVYTVEIRLNSQDVNNYNVSSTIGNLTVKAKSVDFVITNNSPYTYNKGAHSVIVGATTSGSPFANYEVTYKNKDASDTTIYDEHNLPKNAGTYDVIIKINDAGYTVGNITGSKELVINPAELTFTVNDASYTYDETAHTATVTSSPEVDESVFTVAYKRDKDADAAASATDAGTYNIIITINDPNYKRADSDTASYTLQIDPLEVEFDVADNNVEYSGTGKNATVSLKDFPAELTAPSFTYTYKNQDSSDTTEYTTDNPPARIGVFDIVIALPDNYKVKGDYTLTITGSLVMNLGNSPAAMIYKDSAHTDDTDWQQAALNELKTTRHFSESYLPDGCDASIMYPVINNDSSLDFDTDPNTVIVPYSTNNFIDPGIMLNGGLILGETPVEQSVDGLYKVSYLDTNNNEIASRYVVVIPSLGDANGNRIVNAIDSNVMVNYINTSTAVDDAVKARSWDVNKDGSITSDDVNAVLYRFRVKLKPYYPWLNI